MANLIEPRTLKGFRDYPPALMIPRERVLQTAREVYRKYGFAPIDTPAMEYAEVLLGKGGEESDRIVYRFKDHGDRDVALRFDLTVPFARFAAQHINTLGTPFKRYAMGPVWRGENTSAGRYREFWQCDFDTIGTGSDAADIEIVMVINSLFEALGFHDFQIRVNDRLILNGILMQLGLVGESVVAVLRAIDKLDKIGAEKVCIEMVATAGITDAQAHSVLDAISFEGPNEDVLERLRVKYGNYQVTDLEGSEDPNTPGITQVFYGYRTLTNLLIFCEQAGVPKNRLKVDLRIARGLDYYTGPIFETTLNALPTIGSVCSGGRYDNLTSLYTKQKLQGVGASLGVDRLLAAMEVLKHPWLTGNATTASVIVLCLRYQDYGQYHKLANMLRMADINVEVYPEAKKLGAQFSYAEKRGHKLAIIAGETEFAANAVKVKDLAARTEVTMAIDELTNHIRDHV